MLLQILDQEAVIIIKIAVYISIVCTENSLNSELVCSQSTIV